MGMFVGSDGGDGMVSTPQDIEWNNHQNELTRLNNKIKRLEARNDKLLEEKTQLQGFIKDIEEIVNDNTRTSRDMFLEIKAMFRTL